MTHIDTNFIPKSKDYLERFVNSHYRLFHEDMREYRSNMGYGDYPYSTEIIQCMREITHTIREVFGDLSIPEKFISPEDLINKSKWFIDHLESFDSYFLNAVEQIRKVDKNAPIPIPIYEIDTHRRKTIGSFKMFVGLAEKESLENSDLGFQTLQTPVEKIKNLFLKFHDVARQLLERRNENKNPRSTLRIKDEYDVQDLLHGLLKIYFDDIRPEEWNPSYAGSSKRSDFLLKEEKIVIEVKKNTFRIKGQTGRRTTHY